MHAIIGLAFAASCLITNVFANTIPARAEKRAGVVKPKVFILSMFDPEVEVWYGISDFDVLARNIAIPGLSPVYPDAHCTADGEVCQLTM
jgi:purine nucleoside permease